MKPFVPLIFFIFILNYIPQAFAFNDTKTHPKLSAFSFEKSQAGKEEYLSKQLLLENGADTIIEDKKLIDWIKYGAMMEDHPMCRASNHFHNPYLQWSESRLSDTVPAINAYCNDSGWGEYIADEIVSSLTWATGLDSKYATELTASVSEKNTWDWESARNYYFTYLTGISLENGSVIPANEYQKNESLVYTFQALGHLMHLLQDTAVPAHVRNDFSKGHLMYRTEMDGMPWTWIGNGFEQYVKRHNNDASWFDEIPVSGKFDSMHLTDLWDTNQLSPGVPPVDMATIGLAEYTSMNFFSYYTIFSNDLYSYSNEPSYPRKDGCIVLLDTIPHNPDFPYMRKYFSTTSNHPGDPVNHLATVGFLYYWHECYFPDTLSDMIPTGLDDNCYWDYAQKLIPRAIGYSANLLDYFFRGTMDIRKISLQGDGYWISGLDFKVKNTTVMADGSTIEPFGTGDLSLAYRYTIPDETEPVFGLASGVYTVDDLYDPINDDFVAVSVSFPEEGYIPPEAVNVSFTVVFKGRLGNEDDAVVGKAFKKPTKIAYEYRPGGWPNPCHVYTVLPDGSDKRQISSEDWGSDFFFSPDWGPHGMLLAFESEPDDYIHDKRDYFPPREILVVDENSGHIVRRLAINDESHANPINSLFDPTFSPDGSQLAAVAIDHGTVGTYFYGIVLFDVQTGSWNYINGYDYWDRRAYSYTASSIAWSPVEDKIAYAIYEDNNLDALNIHTISSDGTGDLKLTTGNHEDGDPSWSPDGEQIIFISDRDGEEALDIWIMDKNGQNMQKLINCLSNCNSPIFSPDGSRIVFNSGTKVYTADSDGKNITLLEVDAHATSWSE